MAANVNITPELRQEALRLVREGLSFREVARRLNISDSTIRIWAREAGLAGGNGAGGSGTPDSGAGEAGVHEWLAALRRVDEELGSTEDRIRSTEQAHQGALARKQILESDRRSLLLASAPAQRIAENEAALSAAERQEKDSRWLIQDLHQRLEELRASRLQLERELGAAQLEHASARYRESLDALGNDPHPTVEAVIEVWAWGLHRFAIACDQGVGRRFSAAFRDEICFACPRAAALFRSFPPGVPGQVKQRVVEIRAALANGTGAMNAEQKPKEVT
jgi:hypothetical protein